MIDGIACKEALASRYATECTYASLHIADPAGTGAGEVVGGSPAYQRKPITWNPGGVDGSITSNPITFDVPEGTVIKFVGMWNALTGGTYQDKRIFEVTFAAQGTATVILTYTQN